MTQRVPDAEPSPDDLLQYPHFDENEVGLRWPNDWWDGPLNGSIAYRGQRYWFNIHCETEDGNYYYLVYPLSNEQADFADAWFEANKRIQVKWIPLANNPATRKSAELKSLTAEWEAHKAHLPDHSLQQPVGWFCSGSNASFYGV